MIQAISNYVNSRGLNELVDSVGLYSSLIGIVLFLICGLSIKSEKKMDVVFKFGILTIFIGIFSQSLGDYAAGNQVNAISYQLLAIIFGFIGILYQLNKQKEQNKKNHEQSLKIEIFKDITGRIEGSSPEGVATTLNILVGKLKENIEQAKITENKYQSPPFKLEQIHSDLVVIHDRLWKVCSSLERSEIVSDNLNIFRRILQYKIIEMNEIFTRLIFFLAYVLPSENGIKDPEKCYVPSNGNLKKFEEVVGEFHNITSYITAYLYDIQIELQNAFLGGLFDRKLPVREPKEKNEIVLTSTNEIMFEKVKSCLSGLDKKRDKRIEQTL